MVKFVYIESWIAVIRVTIGVITSRHVSKHYSRHFKYAVCSGAVIAIKCVPSCRCKDRFVSLAVIAKWQRRHFSMLVASTGNGDWIKKVRKTSTTSRRRPCELLQKISHELRCSQFENTDYILVFLFTIIKKLYTELRSLERCMVKCKYANQNRTYNFLFEDNGDAFPLRSLATNYRKKTHIKFVCFNWKYSLSRG